MYENYSPLDHAEYVPSSHPKHSMYSILIIPTPTCGESLWDMYIKANILYPKDPEMSQGKDFPYSPIVGMGCFDHQSYSGEGSGFLEIQYIECPGIFVLSKQLDRVFFRRRRPPSLHPFRCRCFDVFWIDDRL